MKESQSLARIPDTLVYAMEFITMATPADQQKALYELRLEVLRSHHELKVPLTIRSSAIKRLPEALHIQQISG